MAQPETSDPTAMSATLDASSSPPKTDTLQADAATSLSGSSSAPQSPKTQSITDTLEGSDDEVQFIFSAPRRKKKRRKVKSSHASADDLKDFAQTAESPKHETRLQPPRRGTTGMVQRSASCHIGDIEGNAIPNVIRSGSLPSGTPNAIVDPSPRPTPFNLSNTSKQPLKFFPFSPFMAIPGWNDPTTQLQDTAMTENNETLANSDDEASKKRKREADLEPSLPIPAQCHQNNQLLNQTTTPSQLDGTQLGSLDYSGHQSTNPSPTGLNLMSSPSSTMRSFRWKPIPNPIYNQFRPPLSATSNSSTSATQPSPRISQHDSLQHNTSIPARNAVPQKKTVMVPVRLVPEQSVSPRTQTVEILRPPLKFSDEAQARHMMLIRRAMNSPSRQGLQQPQNPGLMAPMNHCQQSQTPRSCPPQSATAQRSAPQQDRPFTRPQNQQISPYDLQRKPSLYKVPAWPTPSPPSSPTQTSTTPLRSPNLNFSGESSNARTNRMLSGHNTLQDPRQMNMPLAQVQGGRGPRPIHGMVPMTPPRTPPQTSARSSSSSSPPSQQPLNPNKRKHSPNLIVDIAETCQQNFPFALIAERHAVPIQRVFDTFSAVIQLPLLRCASDNRRHGSLGKRRLKEFRDAKKAMETASKDGDDEGRRGSFGGGRVRKVVKKGAEQPLLRAAILNHASRGKESA